MLLFLFECALFLSGVMRDEGAVLQTEWIVGPSRIGSSLTR